MNNMYFYINKINKDKISYDNQLFQQNEIQNKNVYCYYLIQLIKLIQIDVNKKYNILVYDKEKLNELLKDKEFIFYLKLYELCNSNLIYNFIFISNLLNRVYNSGNINIFLKIEIIN